jgi:hypothetical protein
VDHASATSDSGPSPSWTKGGFAAIAQNIAGKVKELASQPITWLGLAGWVLVVLLLFRKPSV